MFQIKPVTFKRFKTYLQSIPARLKAYVKHRPKTTIALGLFLLFWLFCLPRPLFNQPVSVVLEDRNGELLGARIASDGQWRFPQVDQLPDKYVDCIVAFEDRRFWWHPGVDPISMLRALWLNVTHGNVVSGGSTITMQVIRLARHNPPRTIIEKLKELCMATRLELTYSKKSILALYASHAPFGGNVVGLEAAAWRFYGKRPELLTWAEAATLAVLPNSPGLIHPGRNRNALLQKRNRLLDRLQKQGFINATECELAHEEPLPGEPLPLPQLSPHLMDRLIAESTNQQNHSTKTTGRRWHTTIDRALQQRVTEILARRQELYKGNGVYNMAAVILEVKTGNVLAYVGNVAGAGKEHGESVDVIAAPRSTGSILKPYLYALSLESGDILPNTLLHDVPTQLGQYKPENYYETYDGAVPARRALVRSLNVPFVLLLQKYGLEKFHFNLKRLGISTINKAPEHYGLSLILGGAEANLLDITNTYTCMARELGSFYDRNGKYDPTDFRPPNFIFQKKKRSGAGLQTSTDLLSAGAIWHTFEAMQLVERPTSSGEWELFRAGKRIAWKTGTSFGFRDAWAAGVTPRYAVGVWVGNADGEGRPGLIGVEAAAPVLFEIFEQLPGGDQWFDPPYDDMVQASICKQSGMRAGAYCEADTVWIPKSGLKAGACTFHRLLHLDAAGQYQVSSDCADPAEMQHVPWFVLPPIEEFYYKSKNPSYITPPPFRSDCMGAQTTEDQAPMQFIYPKHITKIYVPVDLNGKLSSTVFQVAHRNPETELFWHLDGVYLGSTKTFHQMALQPPVGKHSLTIVDKDGYRLVQAFEIIGK